jgi:tripartite-type tricarboxylate transporter receptor subunit TctC
VSFLEELMRTFRTAAVSKIAWLTLALLSIYPSKCGAQHSPSGPVRFITQLPAGTGTDPAMRIIADELGRRWGQQTLIMNQPGAGGLIAAREASKAAPDGLTLYMAIASTFVVLPRAQHLDFGVHEFVPIGFVGEVPMTFAVSHRLPVSNLRELIGYSKRAPEGINAAVSLRGGIPHLTAELFRARSGAELTPVFYSGASHGLSDLMSGRVQLSIEGLSGSVAAGQLKVLAIASTARVPFHSEIPTVTETLPGFTASGWFALVAPPRTSQEIARKISADLRAVLSDQAVQHKLHSMSVTTRTMSPAELADFIRNEQQVWAPIMTRAGLSSR